MLLSIIVPVYNVEEYIEECIESLCNLETPSFEYEIILINDGSTDNSVKIIENYLFKFRLTNIKFYSKSNEGLSATRNYGLRKASGKYIWFVDSDDWLVNNWFNIIQPVIKTTSFDVVALTTIIQRNEATTKVNRNLDDNSTYSGTEIYRKSWKFPYSGAQFYLFKREWIIKNNLIFHEGIYYEDLLFVPFALNKANNCTVITQPTYHYRLRANSITTSTINSKHITSIFSVINIYLKEIEINKDPILINMVGRLVLRLNSMLREIKDITLTRKLVIFFEKLPSLKNIIFKDGSIRNIAGWIVVNYKVKKYLLFNR